MDMALFRNRRVEELELTLRNGVNDWGEKLSEENKEYLQEEIERAKVNASIFSGLQSDSVFAGFILGFIVACIAISYSF